MPLTLRPTGLSSPPMPTAWTTPYLMTASPLVACTRTNSSGLQIRYPHDPNGITLIDDVPFGALVARPNIVFLARKALSILDYRKFSFCNVADHRIHHLSGFLRLHSRLHDDIAHGDRFEPWNERVFLAIAADYHARSGGCFCGRGRGCRLGHNSFRQSHRDGRQSQSCC